ncbi:MAG: hypothetical protein V2A65_04920 [Candidatus Omnitrophota bacterium]
MMRYIRIFFLILFLSVILSATKNLILSGFADAQEPQTSYQQAVDNFSNLDFPVSYKKFEGIIKFFPDAPEARQARWWRMIISAVRFSSLEMTGNRYIQAIDKTTLDVHRFKLLKDYVKISEGIIKEGDTFVDDVQEALQYAGSPIKMKSKKNYDSLNLSADAYLPIKKLERGYALTWEENNKVERFQTDAAGRYLMGKVLNLNSDGSEELIKKSEIEGEVDWPASLFLAGNWLLHYGEMSRVGWFSSASPRKVKSVERAELGFQTAKLCYEKVLSLLKNKPSPSLQAQAEEKIKEVDKILKSLK